MSVNSFLDASLSDPLARQNKLQKVIFLRVDPELHAALKAQAKETGATVNKFLTAHIEQLSAAATLRK